MELTKWEGCGSAPARRRGATLIVAGALAAALLAVPVAGAHAATVTKLADTDGECTPADCSLREAIKTGDEVIDFAPDLAGAIVLQRRSLAVSHDVAIRGPGPDKLTIRAWRFGGIRVFTVSGEVTVGISGLRVTGGNVFEAGAGIRNGRDATLTVANTTVTRNEVVSGGSKFFGEGAGIHNAGTMTIVNSTVSRNKTIEGEGGAWGGGISNIGTLTIIGSTVSGNEIDGFHGGGIANGGGNGRVGTLTIINSTVGGNRAIFSGGIHTTRGEVTVIGSTIANNRASGRGPDNLAVPGEGARATLRNTILAVPPRGRNCDVRDPHFGRGTLVSAGYNLADDRSCNLTRGTDQPDTDPMLGPLGNYGGPTATMPLLPASPAIDKGISDGVPTDQRGRRRPVDFGWVPNARGGDGADIGAFERQRLAPFRFGKVRRNKRRGIARLPVGVTGPGRVVLQRRPGVKRFARRTAEPDWMMLRIRPRGWARQRLNRQVRRTGRGRVRIRARVTYRPRAGAPRTRTRRVWLVKR